MVLASLKCDDHERMLEWCDHIQSFILKTEDASLLKCNSHYVVPVFPSVEIFAEVYIGEDLGNGSALMSLNYTPDIGKPYSVRLGVWNPGEGMMSIRSVILDYVRSNLDPLESITSGPLMTACPSQGTHGLRETEECNKPFRPVGWKAKCLWNIVMEKACSACMELSYDDGNYGLDDKDPSLDTRRSF